MEKLALSSIADGNTERRGACGGNLGNMKKNYICICLPIVPAFGKLLEKKTQNDYVQDYPSERD